MRFRAKALSNVTALKNILVLILKDDCYIRIQLSQFFYTTSEKGIHFFRHLL